MSGALVAAWGWAGPIIVAALAGLLGGGAVVVKWQDRRVTRAIAEGKGIDNLRAVIDEVRDDARIARGDADTARGDVNRLTSRVSQLEERERHMLTRAAVHEAWDQFAFAALTRLDPEHPPPPPLTERDPQETP